MNSAFDSIKQGLKEAAEYAENKKIDARTHYPSAPDVQTIRNKSSIKNQKPYWIFYLSEEI
jgi:hypothetical protein